MYRLSNLDTFPPGSFTYVDPNTGKKFGGSYGIREQAQRLSSFRKANNFPRQSQIECIEDIDAYTCARLGNAAPWVYNTDAPATAESFGLPVSAPCAGCGIKVE